MASSLARGIRVEISHDKGRDFSLIRVEISHDKGRDFSKNKRINF